MAHGMNKFGVRACACVETKTNLKVGERSVRPAGIRVMMAGEELGGALTTVLQAPSKTTDNDLQLYRQGQSKPDPRLKHFNLSIIYNNIELRFQRITK